MRWLLAAVVLIFLLAVVLPADGAVRRCSDGIDNDQDGRLDYPADAGCSSPRDNSEGTEGTTPPPPPPPPSGLPASFFTGPAGRAGNLILPANATYPSNGVFFGTDSDDEPNYPGDMLQVEADAGRRFDMDGIHGPSPDNGCYYNDPLLIPFSGSRTTRAISQGYIPYLSWAPGFTQAEIAAGQADVCLTDVAKRARNLNQPVLLRVWWEFNIPGHPYGWAPSGNIADRNPAQFVANWRRMVDIFQNVGATKVNFVWCPHEGWYHRDWGAFGSYPGDAYVDWVCSDAYNHGAQQDCSGNPAGHYRGWCPFKWIFHDNGYQTGLGRNVEMDFRGRKPFLIGETSSAEDSFFGDVALDLAPTVDPKGQWYRDARDYAKSSMPGLYAVIVWDHNEPGGTGDVRIDTSADAYQGFLDWMHDPYFNR
jgi:Glycosyl hydrolase family 26